MSDDHRGCEADIDRLTAEVAALKAQLAASEARVTTLCEEWAGTHTHLLALAKAAGVPDQQAEGDSYGVPGIDELADMALAQATAERDAAREAHEKAIQTQGKIMDGMRADLAAARAEIVEALQAFGDWKLSQDSVGRGLRYRIGLTLADLSTARAEVERLKAVDIENANIRSDRDRVSAELSSARAALGEAEAISAQQKSLIATLRGEASDLWRSNTQLKQERAKAEAALAEVRVGYRLLASDLAPGGGPEQAHAALHALIERLADARLVLEVLSVGVALDVPALFSRHSWVVETPAIAAFRRLEASAGRAGEGQ